MSGQRVGAEVAAAELETALTAERPLGVLERIEKPTPRRARRRGVEEQLPEDLLVHRCPQPGPSRRLPPERVARFEEVTAEALRGGDDRTGHRRRKALGERPAIALRVDPGKRRDSRGMLVRTTWPARLPYYYDPFALYEDGRLDNPNLMVFGEPGSGKSAAVKCLLARHVGLLGRGGVGRQGFISTRSASTRGSPRRSR